MNSSIIFEVMEKEEGGYVAGCYEKRIFAEEDTLHALCSSIQKQIDVYWMDNEDQKPSRHNVKLMLYR